jgi:SulP family sulfate permease
MLVTDNPRIRRQLDATGALDLIGRENLYIGNEWLGDTVRRAHDDAVEWVERDGTPVQRTTEWGGIEVGDDEG